MVEKYQGKFGVGGSWLIKTAVNCFTVVYIDFYSPFGKKLIFFGGVVLSILKAYRNAECWILPLEMERGRIMDSLQAK